jgi:hypothetical protein
MPEHAATNLAKKSLGVWPTGAMMPIPVTTTRGTVAVPV